MFRRDDAAHPSTRDYGDHTEYGGGPGRNDYKPNSRARELSVGEQAQDMRRQGLRDEAPPTRLRRPEPRR